MADIQLAPNPKRTASDLIPAAAIDTLARQIAAQFDPERIYLFGSYAYGTPTRLWVGGRVSPQRDRKLIGSLAQLIARCAAAGMLLVAVDGLGSYLSGFHLF